MDGKLFLVFDNNPVILKLVYGERQCRKVTTTKLLSTTLRGHDDWVTSVAMSGDGRKVILLFSE